MSSFKMVTGLTDVQKQMEDWGAARRTVLGAVVPKKALPVFARSFAAVPNYGTQALVATYEVKPNWKSLICGVVLGFQGNGSAPNPGDVSYTIDIDVPPGGVSAGYTEKDYAGVPFPLGSFVLGPWPCEFVHENGETLRVKATPVANMGVGAGNFFIGALIGWEWVKEGHI
jgi:hypothetical protein